MSTRPDSIRAQWIAWIAIIGVVGYVAYRTAQVRTVTDDDSTTREMAAVIRAKTAITTAALGRRFPTAAVSQNLDLLLREMDREAVRAEDKLRIAILAGEIRGKEPAIERLKAVTHTGTDPELAKDAETLHTIYAEGPETLAPHARERLTARHGFFGSIALAFGVPADTEPRKTVEASSGKTAARALIFAMGVLAFIPISIALFVTAVVLFAKGRIRAAEPVQAAPSGPFIEAFALYLVLFVFASGWLLGGRSLIWEWVNILILPILILWLRWRGVPFEEQRRAFGWHKGAGWWREIGSGLAGYLAGLVVVAAGLVVTYMLVKRTGGRPTHPIVYMLQGDGWHIAGLYTVSCLFAPIMEETMFRGALFRYMRGRAGWLLSALTVSLVFAVLHPQGWETVPVLGAIAMVHAALREWRGSIVAPMVAHAFNNFIALTGALIFFRS